MNIRIKIFIVTYNNDKILKERSLESLLSTVNNQHQLQVEMTVINNYGKLSLESKYDRFKILNNDTRPDWSTGHLARNWNEGLMHGFVNLSKPDADIVVLCQNDTVFISGWINYIIEQHKKYDFIQMGRGDEYHSYTIQHVKKVGMWDERFCGISFQEKDYFLRSILYNPKRSTVNDIYGYKNNAVDNKIIDLNNISGYGRGEISTIIGTNEDHDLSLRYFKLKWGEKQDSDSTGCPLKENYIKKCLTEFMFYPYFEKNIDQSIYNQSINCFRPWHYNKQAK